LNKKLLSLMMVMFSFMLFAEEEPNPFDSFMGMKWGTNAKDYESNFKYPIDSRMAFKDDGVFILTNLKLGTVTIEKVYLLFKKTENNKDLIFFWTNYNLYFFYQVNMNFEPSQFDSILDIFTIKYGTPNKVENTKIQNRMGAEFLQTIAYWENGDRTIILYRYGSKIDKGNATFISKEEFNKTKDKEKKENEKAADVL
jgi:hypothetical protein